MCSRTRCRSQDLVSRYSLLDADPLLSLGSCTYYLFLPRSLNFKNPADYDRVQPTDKVDLIGVDRLAPESEVTMRLKHKDGSTEDVTLTHTFNDSQLAWFRAGSALNEMARSA